MSIPENPRISNAPSQAPESPRDIHSTIDRIVSKYTEHKTNNEAWAKALALSQFQDLYDTCSRHNKFPEGFQKIFIETLMDLNWSESFLYKDLFALEEYIKNPEMKDIPTFDDTVFQKNPELVEKALSQPWTIVSFFEMYKIYAIDYPDLIKNPRFTQMLHAILAKEYPDTFGTLQDASWYKTWGNFDFQKMATLLDATKYMPVWSSRALIDMMNGVGKNNPDEVRRIYDTHFAGTKVGKDLLSAHFVDTRLYESLQVSTGQVLDTAIKQSRASKTGLENLSFSFGDHKPGGILDIIQKFPEWRSLAEYFFHTIPKNTLSDLLVVLPVLEEQCQTWDQTLAQEILSGKNHATASIKKDTYYYMAKFFEGLQFISTLWDPQTFVKKQEYYLNLKDLCLEKLDVTAEKQALNTEKNINTPRFSIIDEAFPPDKDPEVNKQKNKAFAAFLNDTAIFNGNTINGTTKGLLIELWKIFWEDSDIMKKLSGSENGKEVMELLAAGNKEQAKSLQIQSQELWFNTQPWEQLGKTDPKKQKEILDKLKSNISIEAKLEILQSHKLIDTTQIPQDEAKKTQFVNGLIKIITWIETARVRGENYSNPDVQREFAAAWRSGDFTTFNQKIQEREQKREEAIIKQQQEQQAKKGPAESSQKDIPQYESTASIAANFATMPLGQAIAYWQVLIEKKSPNTLTLRSPDGVLIEGFEIKDPDHPQSSIDRAMDSVQFLKDAGLGVFGASLPSIISAINNRPSRWSGEKIDLTQGITQSAGFILLESLGKVLWHEPINWTRDATALKQLQTRFRTTDGWVLGRLQKAGLARSNDINIPKIEKAIKEKA